MRIVIDIPKDLYEDCKRIGDRNDTLFEAIRKGKVLPTGHGRLIDADLLEPDTEWDEYYDGFTSYSELQISDAETIVEADEE